MDDIFVPFSMAGRSARAVDCSKCGQPTCVDVAGASHNDLFYVGGAELLGRFSAFVKGVGK